jgi:plastocyanin
MSFRLLPVVAIVALVVACDQRSPAAPGPSAVPESASMPAGSSSPQASPMAASQQAAAAATAGALERLVTMEDACDPETFNAVLGAGACVRSGGVTFQQFIALLTKHGSIGSWRFSPPTTNVKEGTTFVAVNRGGEEHTFTEVENFGGGIVDSLNQLAGVPVEAPECVNLEEEDRVAPGGTYREEVTETGTLKFQCCIHPWMRLEVQVAASH